MKLEKNGIIYELTDKTQINAFLSAGFVEFSESKEEKKTEAKKVTKKVSK